MSLENPLPTTIAGLVAANPASSDPRTQGDDHIRMIKDVLKKSFTGGSQGLAGAVTVTHAEMNQLAGIGGTSVANQLAGKAAAARCVVQFSIPAGINFAPTFTTVNITVSSEQDPSNFITFSSPTITIVTGGLYRIVLSAPAYTGGDSNNMRILVNGLDNGALWRTVSGLPAGSGFTHCLEHIANYVNNTTLVLQAQSDGGTGGTPNQRFGALVIEKMDS